MQIKRFEAPTMTEALRLIKKELGPDAVILSARSLSQGKSLFGIKKPAGVEVTAAIDTLSSAMETQNAETCVVSAAAGGGRSAQKGQKVSIRIDDSIGNQGLMNTIQTGLKSLSNRKNTQPASAGKDESFKEKFKNHFACQGVEDIYIQELLALFTQKFGAESEWESQDFCSGLLEIFSEMGISAEVPENRRRGPQIHGFVGLAGCGKTATMAKLTAIYTHQFRQKVGWITFDTKRVAAAAQLQVYGKIIGVPVEPVVTVKEFKKALKRFELMDHIFIDTPGMGIRDAQMIEEMSGILKHANVNTYLVASASTKNEDLIQVIKAYQSLSVISLIVSKLDESQTYGNVFNLLMRSKLPVSYFASGQSIPHSLEEATLEKVVELILNPARESKPWDVPPGKTAEIIPYVKNNSHRFRNLYVANQNAVLFHHPECAWAKRIKPENRIAFESIEDAVSKNYIPCKTCCSHIPEIQDMTEAEVHRVGNGQPYYSR
jgi:flagellar biosynthesis protein FlhF